MEIHNHNLLSNNEFAAQISTNERFGMPSYSVGPVVSARISCMETERTLNAHIGNNEHFIPSNRLVPDSNEKLLFPDTLSFNKFREQSKGYHPRIKIKALKELQKPEIYKQNEQIIQTTEQFSKQHDSMKYKGFQAQGIMGNLDGNSLNIVSNKNKGFNNNIILGSSSTQHRPQRICLKPPVHITPKYVSVIQETEHSLKKKYINFHKEQGLSSNVNYSEIGFKTQPVTCIETETESSDNTNSRKMQMVSDASSNMNIKTLENAKPKSCKEIQETKQDDKQENNQFSEGIQVDKTNKEIEITALKEGIIESSRTLINTQKTLKLLSQILSIDVLYKDRQAINLITKFQNTLKSFRKRIYGIGKTVKSQYQDWLPSTPDIDSLLKSIKESHMPKKEENFRKLKKKIKAKQKAKPSVLSNKDCLTVAERSSTGSVSNKREYSESEQYNNQLNILEVLTEGNHKIPKVGVKIVQPNQSSNRKRKLSKVAKSTDDEFNKTMELNTKTGPRRVILPRSCRKWQMYIEDDEEEFEWENN